MIFKSGRGYFCGKHGIKCVVVKYIKECPVCHEQIIVDKCSNFEEVKK